MALDGHINPQTGVWDDNYWASHGGAPSNNSGGNNNNNSGGGFNATDIIANAQKLQDFYKTQNQPVIAATEATKAPLEQRYQDLLAGIKGNQTIAENRQTMTTNNELGRRGITGNSGLGQQTITDAVNPITQQYTNLQKDTTGSENTDLAGINATIASLNAGNPAGAVSGATGIAGASQAASQFQQQQALAEKQQAFGQRYIMIPNVGLYDVQANKVMNATSHTGLSGGGWSVTGV